MSAASSAPASWLDDGEKYALVGLDVKIEGAIPRTPGASNLLAIADTAFVLPPHWKEWLGTIRAGEVEHCNLFLLSKLRSATPDVLDGENQTLQRRAWNFYLGLLLAIRFAPAYRPVLLTGSKHDGEIGMRQQQDLEIPIPCVFGGYPAVTTAHVTRAVRLAENLEALIASPPPGGTWRLFRTLHIYIEARTTHDILDRLHQYCRCIDGVILPKAGETKRQFKSRTELFIGPKHHDLMGEMYDVRSAVEHLHENRYLEGFDRNVRLDLVKKEAVAEYIARTTLAKIIEQPPLHAHFANTAALATFWALTDVQRKAIWGSPIDPLAALAGFDPKYIHDGLLGA